jgi:hypothetical protein
VAFEKSRMLANRHRDEKSKKNFFSSFRHADVLEIFVPALGSFDAPAPDFNHRKKEEALCASPEVVRRIALYLSSTSSPTSISR